MVGNPGMGMDTGAPVGADPNTGAPAAQGEPNSAPVAPPPGFAPQGADPMAGDDPNMMGGDPNAMGDPGMDIGMEEEPMDADMSTEEGDDDSTASLLGRLSDEDKEAARKYILSMLDDDEGVEEEPAMGPEGSDAPMPDAEDEPMPEEPAPMAESIILKKSQFKKINENIGVSELEKDEKKKRNEPKINKNKRGPFGAPKFCQMI